MTSFPPHGPQQQATPASAQELFADFVELLECGELVNFEAWVAGYPQQQAALRRIHRSWQAMQYAFSTMSQAPAARNPRVASGSLQELMSQIGNDRAKWRRYAIGPELARGAMGRIHRAWDQELHRDVAIKFVHAGHDDRMGRRFVEEAQIAAQLDHPGVVPIHELGLDPDGKPYFAMRLVRGDTFAHVLAAVRDGSPEWTSTRALHVLLRVCEVIAYAHHKGVIHRDLKPANVMLGSFGEVYVMDWGLARVTTPANGNPSLETVRAEIEKEYSESPLLTLEGDIVGTPAYMAPEQALDSANLSPESDIYSIGAMLYHLLAGAPPYLSPENPSAKSALLSLREGPPAPLPAPVSPELRAICETAMARDPRARYSSAAALGDDLRAYLEGRVVAAYAKGSMAELRKWVGRNKATACFAALLLLSLLIGVAATSSLWLAAEASRLQAEATADELAEENTTSRLRAARQSMLLDNTMDGGQTLWQLHFEGSRSRATHWALRELATREPTLAIAKGLAADIDLYHPTGAVVAARADGKVVLMLAETLAVAATITVGTAPLKVVAAAPHAPLALVGDAVGVLSCCDFDRRQVVSAWSLGPAAISALAWLPNGQSFVAANASGEVFLGTPQSAPRRIATLGSQIDAMLPLADGAIACGGLDHVLAIVGADGVPMLQSARTGLSYNCLCEVGAELWAGHNSHGFDVFNRTDLRFLRTVNSRNGTVRDFAKDADGSILTAGWWRVDRHSGATTTEELSLSDSRRIALDPLRRRLVQLSRSWETRLYDISNRDIAVLANNPNGVALSGDGNTLALSTNTGNTLVDPNTLRVLQASPQGLQGALLLNATASYAIVMRRQEMTITLCRLPDWHPLLVIRDVPELGFYRSAAFSPTQKEVAIESTWGIVRYALPSLQVLGELPTNSPQVTRIEYSADGNTLYSLCRDSKQIRRHSLVDNSWADISCGSPETPGNGPSISAFTVDRAQTRIAIGWWSGKVFLQNLRDQSTTQLAGRPGTVWDMKFSPSDPDILAVVSGADGVHIWDLVSRELCYQDSRLDGPVTGIDFTPNGRFLACRSRNQATLLDLAYRDRHVAVMLTDKLAAEQPYPASPARLAELAAWSKATLAMPLSNWR